jgi:hypothetical protein
MYKKKVVMLLDSFDDVCTIGLVSAWTSDLER